MLVANSFDLWKKDIFFSAAEEVQQSADIMESAYRTWIRARREGLIPEHLDELERELQMGLGTAKWQLEEFEKAVRLSYKNLNNDITMTRHRQFVSAIEDQILRVEIELKESYNAEGKKPFRWVNLDADECDDLALFLSGSSQGIQDDDVKHVGAVTSSGNNHSSLDSEITSNAQVSNQEKQMEEVVTDNDISYQTGSSRRYCSSPVKNSLEIVIDINDNMDNNVLTETTPKEKGSKPFTTKVGVLSHTPLKIISRVNQYFGIDEEMANAYGLSTPTVPTLMKSFCSYNRSRLWLSDDRSRVIVCSATSQSVDKLSTTESRVPRFVNKGCKLVGCGSAVPDLLISNDDLSNIVDTNDEWISVRTGIRNRRILSRKESLTDLAAEAAKKALEMAQVHPDEVDLVLLCTSTPEDLFGGAPQIQKALGCKNNPLAYDITAACSGFVLGLVSAACHIRGGGFKNVLVIGADALSRYVDWTDRGSCILFGDAAGAVLVQACDIEEDGLISFDLHSDGDGQRHLKATMTEKETDSEIGTNGSLRGLLPKPSSYSCIQMNGKEVFRFAARVVPQSIELALEKAGISSSSIDWLLLHQANQRIIDAVATRLDVPSERVISNLANYGNTSAASIPLALDEAVRSGKVKAGHTIATAGFGAGLTWGSAIIRWG